MELNRIIFPIVEFLKLKDSVSLSKLVDGTVNSVQSFVVSLSLIFRYFIIQPLNKIIIELKLLSCFLFGNTIVVLIDVVDAVTKHIVVQFKPRILFIFWRIL